MKKQKKISQWLTGLCLALALLVLAAFGLLTWYILFSGHWYTADRYHILVIFAWYTAAICFAVLFQFRKVCVQIGLGNSFSEENALSFHRMAQFGAASGIGALLRLVYDAAIRMDHLLPYAESVLLAILSVVFVILCEALSQLIRNAYEMKLENEYTI